MALKLAKQVNGYTAEYWRIDRFDVEPRFKKIWCRLGLYKDEAYAKSDGAKPVQTRDMTFSGVNYPAAVPEISKVDTNIIGELYKQIKKPVITQLAFEQDPSEVGENTNEFTESEDC